YLRLPFASEELAARLQALMSFSAPDPADLPDDTRLIFDISNRAIEAGNQRVVFSPSEWAVLIALVEQDYRPITAEDLVASIEAPKISSSAIPSIVSRIRRRLRSTQFDLIIIETVHRRGYAVRF